MNQLSSKSPTPLYSVFSNTSRKDNDSKDEVSKVVSQAEKELEELRKLIDDSGGKLSSRGLESEVRATGYGIGLNCLGQPSSLTPSTI